ncbi:MAG: pyrimidine reductase family protein [Actinobacteria bacterium]|nr:pyrimidine reductase family protein [Actinomycetota bacterium]
MSDTPAGTYLTEFGPTTVADDDRLTAWYAYPDGLRACWVRGNMITSLDGGATDGGLSGGLGGPGDRAVFALMRGAADVVIVGAATVRAENYAGAQLSVAQRQARQRRGQAEVPPIAVVTRSADLDPDGRLFTLSAVAPLILTCTRSVADARHRLGGVAEVIDASATDPGAVDPARVLAALAMRKLFRVLAEGGPHLMGLLIADGLLDELCLTIAPVLVGGAASRIATGAGAVHTRMRRAHVLSDDDGYLYTRYIRHG